MSSLLEVMLRKEKQIKLGQGEGEEWNLFWHSKSCKLNVNVGGTR
jgi:hypothetical protein